MPGNKKRVVIKRRRMIHIEDPAFHKKKDQVTGFVLFSNSTLPVKNPDKKYFVNITKIFLNNAGTHLPFFPKVEESNIENFVSANFGIQVSSILYTKRMFKAENIDIYFIEIDFKSTPALSGFVHHNMWDLYSNKTVSVNDLYLNIISQKKHNKMGINSGLRKKYGGRIIGNGKGLPISIKKEAIYRQMIGAFEIDI